MSVLAALRDLAATRMVWSDAIEAGDIAGAVALMDKFVVESDRLVDVKYRRSGPVRLARRPSYAWVEDDEDGWTLHRPMIEAERVAERRRCRDAILTRQWLEWVYDSRSWSRPPAESDGVPFNPRGRKVRLDS